MRIDKVMYSYTSLKFGVCSRLFSHYQATHQALLDSSLFSWGRSNHERFQDRIISEKPKNEFETSILVMADDWLYEYEVSRENFHGILDLYSPSRNIAIEYKLNRYDPLQLDFYAWLIDGEVYLYRDNKELVKHEPNWDRLQQFIEKALKNISGGQMHMSMMCSQCVIAHTCPLLEQLISEGDIDARLLLAENYKQRAKMLEDIDIEENCSVEKQFYRISVLPQNVYKLKKGIDRQEVVRKLIESNRFDLLEFTPANIKEILPDVVVEIQQVRKKIERKED